MYFFIEKPWRFDYSKNKKFFSVIILTSIIGFCFFTINQNGFVDRLVLFISERTAKQIKQIEKGIL